MRRDGVPRAFGAAGLLAIAPTLGVSVLHDLQWGPQGHREDRHAAAERFRVAADVARVLKDEVDHHEFVARVKEDVGERGGPDVGETEVHRDRGRAGDDEAFEGVASDARAVGCARGYVRGHRAFADAGGSVDEHDELIHGHDDATGASGQRGCAERRSRHLTGFCRMKCVSSG